MMQKDQSLRMKMRRVFVTVLFLIVAAATAVMSIERDNIRSAMLKSGAYILADNLIVPPHP